MNKFLTCQKKICPCHAMWLIVHTKSMWGNGSLFKYSKSLFTKFSKLNWNIKSNLFLNVVYELEIFNAQFMSLSKKYFLQNWVTPLVSALSFKFQFLANKKWCKEVRWPRQGRKMTKRSRFGSSSLENIDETFEHLSFEFLNLNELLCVLNVLSMNF